MGRLIFISIMRKIFATGFTQPSIISSVQFILKINFHKLSWRKDESAEIFELQNSYNLEWNIIVKTRCRILPMSASSPIFRNLFCEGEGRCTYDEYIKLASCGMKMKSLLHPMVTLFSLAICGLPNAQHLSASCVAMLSHVWVSPHEIRHFNKIKLHLLQFMFGLRAPCIYVVRLAETLKAHLPVYDNNSKHFETWVSWHRLYVLSN